MFSIRRCDPPLHALHLKYQSEGAYIDCYTTTLRGAITHAQFVEAFYTTLLFKLERLVLFIFLFKTSTDGEAHRLALGELQSFAAWTVEGRAENQLLMCDIHGSTRSWLMAALEEWEGDVVTRLYFGSVVVARIDRATGKRKLGMVVNLLTPFHRVYSRALLGAARWRLKRALWRK